MRGRNHIDCAQSETEWRALRALEFLERACVALNEADKVEGDSRRLARLIDSAFAEIANAESEMTALLGEPKRIVKFRITEDIKDNLVRGSFWVEGDSREHVGVLRVARWGGKVYFRGDEWYIAEQEAFDAWKR